MRPSHHGWTREERSNVECGKNHGSFKLYYVTVPPPWMCDFILDTSLILTIYRTAMPVVSAPCSCQHDCLVCGRGDVPPHDWVIHVLLESMVFQEHMLYGEPTEARLEEILQNGKDLEPCI
ncbi:uncharacterized protein TNCV_4339131 [Trichonephila clavipes]|nr:uncharacterized protein TNCV_4339131 [Trichonephila clavipes]